MFAYCAYVTSDFYSLRVCMIQYTQWEIHTKYTRTHVSISFYPFYLRIFLDVCYTSCGQSLTTNALKRLVDDQLEKKNFTNWPIKNCFKAFVASYWPYRIHFNEAGATCHALDVWTYICSGWVTRSQSDCQGPLWQSSRREHAWHVICLGVRSRNFGQVKVC